MLIQSAYASLTIQFITGIINFLGIRIKVPDDQTIFKDLLRAELVVQIIEFIFYIWMIRNLVRIDNITPYRYMDWMLSTPVMLITLVAFLEKRPYKSLKEFVQSNKSFVGSLVVLNLLMLLFGLLGELKMIDYNTAIILGFIPFVYYFKLIHDKYIKETDLSTEKTFLFWFFVTIWSLYGIVAFLPYNEKNISYNILDLLSKNLFGLFLVYTLWKRRM